MSNATAGAIAHITEVVTRVTRILSNKQIRVVQQGMKVGVDYDAQGAPVAVYLPSLTENPSPELLTAIQGFLDKEVSTLLYTDFDARHRNKSTSEFKRGVAKSIQDIIEDARTEREMRKQFRGSASNFDKNHDFAVKEILEPSLAHAKNEQERIATLALPAIRAACGDLAYEEFMDGKWEDLGKLGGAILHYADEIQNVDSTEDTFTLTRKIIQKMEEQDGDGDGEGDDDQGEGEGEGEAGSDADADGESGGGSEGDGESDGDEAQGESDDGDGDEGNPGDQKVNQDKVDLSKVNNSRKLNKSSKKPRGSGGSGTSKGLHQFDKLDEAFEDMNFDNKMAEKIKKIAGTDAAAQGAYMPYSRQYDYVGPIPNAAQALKNFASSSHAKNLLDNVDKNSHVIQQQIQKLFMAKALVRWEPGQKRGKINSTSLYKLGQGDPRIFRRKIESNSRDVAVALVIDMSGSMSGTKIQNACVAALMFSKVLTNLGIKHEISAFTTYSGYYGSGGKLPNSAEVNEMIRNCDHAERLPNGKMIHYSRITPITNYILKSWDQRLNEDIRRTVAMVPSGYPGLMSGNVDGESIDLAGRRLLGQKEKKKVMIVMSDGCPASDGHGGDLVQHLKATVKNLSAAGVEMLGLGLQDNSVKQFYPKSEVVMAADQIPSKILELTRKMVVGV